MFTRARIVLCLFSVVVLGGGLVQAHDLRFEERVRAQEAIERVYFSHQVGASRSFEATVPRSTLEKKVKTYLRQSAVLDSRWHSPITPEALQRELERIAHESRFPQRLREIYAALGHDAVLIQECFVRPVLVDRLSRSFFASDERIHADARAQAESIRERLASGKLDYRKTYPLRSVVEIALSPERGSAGTVVNHGATGRSDSSVLELGAEEFRKQRAAFPERVGVIGPILDERDAFVVSVVMIDGPSRLRAAKYRIEKTGWDTWWNRFQEDIDEGSVKAVAAGLVPLTAPQPEDAGCEPDNVWENGSLDDFPENRINFSMIWTGNLVIIWGGQSNGGSGPSKSGWRYDPLIDTWSPITTNGAPEARSGHTAVWTGSKMIIWGGSLNSRLNSGGRYDPITDSWSPTTLVGAPSFRANHSAVWTGTEMIIWGGLNPFKVNPTSPPIVVYNSGGRYNPNTDSWIPTRQDPTTPSVRAGHTAVWTGSEMIVWGGYNIPSNWPTTAHSELDTGSRYNPSTDTWIALPFGPSKRAGQSAVWTGSEMIIWGGSFTEFDTIHVRTSTVVLNTGSRYEPAHNTWTPTLTDATSPSARTGHVGLWTGSEMIIWGGQEFLGTQGYRYIPSSDSWTVIADVALSGNASGVWTGSKMVVWEGGSTKGGRYDPATDSWTPTASIPARPRSNHVAQWTGNLMLVWGGVDPGGFRIDTGDRYDPLTDSWSPISQLLAPSARSGATSVWTGDRMIVWGASEGNQDWDTGALYNPVADTWTATRADGTTPRSRTGHVAVWTGSEMVVWGGTDYHTHAYLNDGSRYNPISNTWNPTSVTGAPAGRVNPATVWTGDRMIVWGGGNPTPFAGLNTGGKYDPASDSWASTSTLDAPTASATPLAVWTGSRMVVWSGVLPDFFPIPGGQYDPLADTWSSISTAGAPEYRTGPSVTWTGNAMVVWGGVVDNGFVQSGRAYDPAADNWTTTSTLGAPVGRGYHSAIWTGSQMIVWGGSTPRAAASGGRYIPLSSPDGDADGFSACGGDCDDANPLINPAMTESCDGIDQNCDGSIDLGGDSLCDDANYCTTDLCGGVSGCSHTSVPDGAACTDRSECTRSDSCQAGVCVGANPVVCAGQTACSNASTCDATTGLCSFVVPFPDGTICDDGNSCTTGDHCQSGVCTGTGQQNFFTIDVNPSRIKFHNHRMVDIAVTPHWSTACVADPNIVLVSVSSSEPDDAPGNSDGDTVNDIQGVSPGTADFNFQVRAETIKGGPGRTYFVTYQAVFASGERITVIGYIFVDSFGPIIKTFTNPPVEGRKKSTRD